MGKASTQVLLKKKTMPTKLVMGLMVAAISVFVGTAGVADATRGGGSHNNNGYGGDISIGIGDIIGDNNVIVIIVNYFSGH